MAPTGTARLLDGRYQLDGLIASGTFAEIWRGRDVVLARPVAVKLLRPEHAGDGEILARFRAEARFGGIVAHENIARIYDCDEPGPGHPPFLVMELVDGPALAEVLAGAPLDPARTMDVVAQGAAGLAAAHRAGLVHGDIRPGNLLLARGSMIKIIGFGRPRSPSAGQSPASDLYDLGIVAGECLAGDRPRTGPDSATGGYRSSPPLPGGVPAAIAALISELMADDPAERPRSAYEVSRRAGELRDEAAGAAAGPATGQLNLWLADPADAGLPDGAGEPATAPGGTGVTSAGQRDGEPDGRAPWGPEAAERQRAARAYPRRRAVLWAAGAAVLILVVLAVAVPRLLHGPAAPANTARTGQGGQRTVRVSAAALDGQPVAAVRGQLSRLGLLVRVRWQVSSRVAPGLVLSVTPTGKVPSGSVVVVTGALSPSGFGGPPGDQSGSTGPGRNGNQPAGPPRPRHPASPAPSDSPSPSASPSGTASATPTAPASPPASATPPANSSPPDPSPSASASTGR
jgi:eukaryotic-like serine/threonine-protein kinase